MYLDFDEIIDGMITPEINEDEFIKLLLTSELSYDGRLMLTENFNYNLNPQAQEDLNFFVDNVRFKAKIFLKSIEKLSPEEIRKNQNGITNERFISFMSFLSTITPENYWKLVSLKKDNNIGDENITKRFIGYYEKLLGDKHGFDFLPTTHSWYYFRSYSMSPANTESFHSGAVKHRLYVAINYDQLMNFTMEFITKLENMNQPYLLKIKSCTKSGKCPENDVMVIYADTEERVLEYVNLLNDMIKSKPEYEQSIHRPSPHLGIIDGRIGYGREFKKNTSYSGVVGKIGDDAIRYALKYVNEDSNFFHGIMKPTRKEMLKTIGEMERKSHSKDIYIIFKSEFWKKFYQLCRQEGYEIDESICIGDREEKYEYTEEYSDGFSK